MSNKQKKQSNDSGIGLPEIILIVIVAFAVIGSLVESWLRNYPIP